MGNSLPKLFTKAENDTRVVMVGLDAAGKTTILYKLKLGEIVTAIPTIGFNVETVEYKNVNFTVWDTGGRSRIRALERFYFSDLNAMIFVVDSNDRDRMESSVQEFYTTLSDFRVPKDERFVPKGNLCILILANKQDLPQAMTAEEVAENFNLYSVRDYPWYVHETCAITGDGLFEGLDWLSDALKLGVNAPKTWTVNGKVPEFSHSRDDGAAATTSSRSDVAADGATDDGAGTGETNVGGGSDGATDDGTSEAVDAEPYDGPSLIQLAMAAENKRTDGLFEESALVEAYGTTLQASIDANGAVEVEAMNDCDDDAVVAAFEEAAAQVDAGQGDEVDWDVFTHAATMRLMYILLSRVEDRNAGRKVAVDRIFEILEKVKTGKHGFFHVTHTYFYIQLVDLAIHLPDELEQVPEAAVSAAAGSGDVTVDADGTTTGESADGRAFRGFLTRRLYLLNESLITHYYTRELIFQDETSMSEFVLPDIQGLPSILNFNVGRAE